jgi:hypothetical protein
VIQAGFSLEALRPTLAVIPFDTRDAAPEHHVLGEVLAEEMIRELSHSRDLNLISRRSTTAFRGRQVTLAEINAHLNADYVLSGPASPGCGLIKANALRPATCQRRSMVGSPRASTPPILRTPRRCSGASLKARGQQIAGRQTC